MIEKTNIQVLAGARQQSMDHCKSNQAGDWTRILLTANSALVLYFITKDLLVQFALSSKTRDRIHLILLGKLLDFMFMSMSYQHPTLQTRILHRSGNVVSEIWNPILSQGQTLIASIYVVMYNVGILYWCCSCVSINVDAPILFYFIIKYPVFSPGPPGLQMMSRGRILDSIRKHLENVLRRREAAQS